MTTSEKVKVIQQTDSWVQDTNDKYILGIWEQLIGDIYQNAAGNGYGWRGIGEEAPEIIDEVFEITTAFISANTALEDLEENEKIARETSGRWK